MGLESQLTGVSSESIPILLVVIIASGVRYLRSCLFAILKPIGLSRLNPNPNAAGAGVVADALGSGLAGLSVLAEQINLNRAFSYRFGGGGGGCDAAADSQCVVCLDRMRCGDRVRKLACGHVFHKDCLDGWLDQLNFSCPLCRHSLVSGERVACTERRVTGDLLAWFSLR